MQLNPGKEILCEFNLLHLVKAETVLDKSVPQVGIEDIDFDEPRQSGLQKPIVQDVVGKFAKLAARLAPY